MIVVLGGIHYSNFFRNFFVDSLGVLLYPSGRLLGSSEHSSVTMQAQVVTEIGLPIEDLQS